MRVYGDEVLEKNDDARSQRRPEERSAAAQGDHEKHLHRSCQLQIHRADEAVVVRPQHAGEAAETTCNDKPDVLVEPHVITERSHARLALSDPHQGLAERGANDRAEDPEGDEKSRERKIIEWNRKSE